MFWKKPAAVRSARIEYNEDYTDYDDSLSTPYDFFPSEQDNEPEQPVMSGPVYYPDAKAPVNVPRLVEGYRSALVDGIQQAMNELEAEWGYPVRVSQLALGENSTAIVVFEKA